MLDGSKDREAPFVCVALSKEKLMFENADQPDPKE